MAYLSQSSGKCEHALVNALIGELERAENSPLHGVLHISFTAAVLKNGIKQCSVQVECQAGCGYLIQAFGEEADRLHEKAIAVQSLINGEVEGYPSTSLPNALRTIFPGIAAE
jgi:hypothetical protein